LECDLDLEREPDFCDFGDFRESTDFLEATEPDGERDRLPFRGDCDLVE
jgi:hypothetical protein